MRKYLNYSVAALSLGMGIYLAVTQTPTTLLVQTMNYVIISILSLSAGLNEKQNGGKNK